MAAQLLPHGYDTIVIDGGWSAGTLDVRTERVALHTHVLASNHVVQDTHMLMMRTLHDAVLLHRATEDRYQTRRGGRLLATVRLGCSGC